MNSKINQKQKQIALRILRKMKLLYFTELLRFCGMVIKNSHANRLFLKEHRDFNKPPLYLMHDAYSNTNYKVYYESGIRDSGYIGKLIGEFMQQSDLVVCEWGCGPARIIQHLNKHKPGIVKLIGTDYNQKTIAWCQKTFPNINFILNRLTPPLDLQDNSVDVFYAISVFTHLSEQQHFAWINEIKRILKPGGLLIFTVHGETYKHKLLPDELKKYQKGVLVTRSNVVEGSRLFSSFHNELFVRNELLPNFIHVKQTDDNPIGQTVWCALLKK